MTILYDQQVPEFDRDPALEASDRAQPVAVEASDRFIVLSQQDGTNEMTHCILIERRDIEVFIEAIRRAT